MLKLKLTLYDRADRYKKKYPVIILSGNIDPLPNQGLPSLNDKMVNFKSDYSPVYLKESEGLVNTRFSYPFGGAYKINNREGFIKAYAKLNWWQRRILNLIEKKSIFHKHPFPILFLILNLLGLIPVWIPFLFPSDPQSTHHTNSNTEQGQTKPSEGPGLLQLEYGTDSLISHDSTTNE